MVVAHRQSFLVLRIERKLTFDSVTDHQLIVCAARAGLNAPSWCEFFLRRNERTHAGLSRVYPKSPTTNPRQKPGGDGVGSKLSGCLQRYSEDGKVGWSR